MTDHPFANFRELATAFGGTMEFGKICGYEKQPRHRANEVITRNSLPVLRWKGVIAEAAHRGIEGVTPALLYRLHYVNEAAG